MLDSIKLAKVRKLDVLFSSSLGKDRLQRSHPQTILELSLKTNLYRYFTELLENSSFCHAHREIISYVGLSL